MPTTPVSLDQMTPVMHRVVARRQDLVDTVTLWLEPIDHPITGLDRPAAGQFNMLWSFGIGEAPISLAGIGDGWLEHTIRDAGAVTAGLCASVEGDEVGVRGPFGTGWGLSRAEGHDVVIIAGGLGMAPVRPILLATLANRERFGRVTLLMGARSPESILYASELEEWSLRPDIDVALTVDTADPAWRGEVGVVTRLLDAARFDPDHTVAFVCGPEIMMRFAATTLLEHGVPADRIEVSLERNMHCAIGHCGHCQLGPAFICRDGPVLGWPIVAPLLKVRER